MLNEKPVNNIKSGSDYKKLLNTKDPLDKQILNLVKQGELKVAVVGMKEKNKQSIN